MFNEFYLFPLFPLAVLVVILGFLAIDKLLLLIVFCTPLALNIDDVGLGMGISLPTEPLMAGILLLFMLKYLYQGSYDSRILKHPISIAIMLNIVWIGLTSITSAMPLVSLKFFISRLWFVVPFYFLAVLMFKHLSNIKRFMWLFMIPLGGVIVYTVIRMWQMGFEKEFAHWVMQPFFKDHSVYAAVIAIFMPVLAGFVFYKKYHINYRVISGLMFLLFSIGMLLSYTRAAWVSLLAALGVFVLIYFKIKIRTVVIAFAAAFTLLLYFQEDIFMSLEKNRQDSSSDIAEHVESISNVATDASNLERLNRWNCAFKMFMERPVFGWGPGTYQFQYASFQHSSELTIISTNAGDVGNAHSEYLGPLAEEGLLGALTFLAIVIAVFYSAIKLYFRLKDKELKMLILTIMLGLVTYLTHGFLNNFLDVDKASVPFWAFVAVIVAVDLRENKETGD
ncbi:MAG: hypothetical protein COA57_00950 [Flavobacteriales bacterium]|nr:MAG: hypothetical protein COA57_00950 [Flavobacteriales bacterium]